MKKSEATTPRLDMISQIAIVRAEEGGPIRTFVERGHRKPVGKFNSAKNGRAHPWEAVNERHLLWISEVDPKVVTYLAQPWRLEISLRGEQRKLIYFPDLERQIDTGSVEVIEVKKEIEEICKDPQYAFKIKVARKACAALGYKFRVLTPENYIHGPRLENAVSIKRDRNAALTTADLLKFEEAMAAAGGTSTWGGLVAALSVDGDPFDGHARRKLHALIIRRLAAIDIDRRIRPTTLVRKIQR
ncbi:hypothetical protein NP284_08605 [Rhodopseudomonas pseudopalustris]|uniref:Tn7 transposase TnsA N-terminal domain-containing protein n=1 Tax=Rhodopseudomonas pseudopalustris TaxID=1513892 RepID=UPI003F956643